MTAPLSLEKLQTRPEFQHFLQSANPLKFFLELHREYPELTSSPEGFFSCPIELTAFFPRSKSRLIMLDLGVVVVLPQSQQRGDFALALSVGLHGNETAPIEIVNDHLRDLLEGEITAATPVLLLYGHFEAMLMHRRQIEENLNRCFDPHKELIFSGRSQESARAYRLKKAMASFVKEQVSEACPLFHLDLHTAIRGSLFKRFCILPHQDRRLDRRSLQVMSQMGVEAILYSDGATTTFSYYSCALYQAHSYTVELGSVKPFGLNHHEDFVDARSELMRLIIEGTWPAMTDGADSLKAFDVVRTLKRTSNDFKLLFAEDLPNFTPFKKGTPLMLDGSKTFTSHDDEERIVFPNSKVDIGERAALIVRPRNLS